LKRGVLGFWALYFSLVLASNFADGLKTLGWLGPQFPFASANYALIRRVTAIYGTPAIVVAVLFIGVLLWEAAATWLFWRAVRRFRREFRHDGIYTPFGVAAGLWASFIVMDEVFISYGLASAHVGLLTLQLVTLLVVVALPEPPR
jgi:hypothetical protein